MKKNLYLAVAYHEEHWTLNAAKRYFNPVHVGKAKSKLELGIQSDDGKDSISSKNKSYNELTALHFMWKNIDADYYGLMHYRRYFFSKYKFYYYRICDKLNLKHTLAFESKRYFLNTLNHYNIILPKKKTVGNNMTVYEQYSRAHHKKDMDIVEEIIKNDFNLEFYTSYQNVMNAKEMYRFNMFISDKSFFDGYMRWLFEIVEKLENKITISDDSYQRRVFGFISERLLNIYIDYKITNHRLKIYELPVYFMDDGLQFRGAR